MMRIVRRQSEDCFHCFRASGMIVRRADTLEETEQLGTIVEACQAAQL